MIPDKLAKIKARHESTVLTYENQTQENDGAMAHYDRDDLLSYVETLTKERNEAREAAENMRARFAAKIAGDSQRRHYERANLLFFWEVKP